jgi:4-amino-4-deoxy-L-arabinose transferase-like glycosyltransferase
VLTTTGRRADHPPTTRAERIAVAVVTVAFGLWLLVWALVVPVFQAPDETAHIDATVHLAIGAPWVAPGDMHVLNAVQAAAAQQATLPKSEWSDFAELLGGAPGESSTVDQMTQHPPTAYLVGAVVLKALHFADLRWDHAVLALRLVDVAAVTLLPLLTWASVRRLTRSPRAALVGALALFATPQLASIASSVSNDAPVMLFAGVVVWLSVRLLTGDLRWRTTIALGVALGALIWIKGTGLPAVPFVALVALVAGAGALTLPRRLLRTVVTVGVAGLIGAWWWLHNIVTYGRVQPNGYTAMRPPKDFPPGEHPTLAHFLDVSWGTLARTFWGSPGIKAQVSIGDLLTSLLTLVALVVVVAFAFRRAPDRRTVLVLAVFPALLIAIQTYTSAHAYLTTTEVAATQGRYYFPAIICLVALSAVAWRRLAPGGRAGDGLAVGLAAVLPGIGLYGLGVVSSWFWNAARSPLTAAGVARYEALGPVPPALVAVVVLLVLAGLVATVVAVVRTGGSARLPDTAERATTVA